MNDYRFININQEPTEEQLAQLMREVAEATEEQLAQLMREVAEEAKERWEKTRAAYFAEIKQMAQAL